MRCSKCLLAGVMATIFMLAAGVSACGGQEARSVDSAVFGEFVGTSPCTESIGSVLQIPVDANLHIRWNLTLNQNAKTQAPAGYLLRCEYPSTVAVTKAENGRRTVTRRGTWAVGKGTKWNPDAVVYELDGAVALYRLNHHILHVLNPDLSLMVGNGSHSYTLNRTESAEPLGTPAPPPATRPESYKILPREKGPTVFGVFAGRTPYQGIARYLKKDPTASGTKVKWHLTLFQDPTTLTPTTYRLEGTLYRRNFREGKWSVVRGTATDPNAIVYKLEPTERESELSLLKGDDNVIFFLDGNRQPFVGHAEFSYTLNRASPD